MKYVVAKLDEIPPGGRKIVTVGRRSIGIFNLNGELYALRNKCPHMGAELCRGHLWGIVESSVPGEFDYTPGGEILSCPHHGWEFHIRTGQSWCDPARLRVSEYQVGIEKGSSLLDEESGADEQGPAGKVKGPYLAETVTVEVENEYVVLDMA